MRAASFLVAGRRVIPVAVLALALLASACAPRVTVSLPSGSGRPDPTAEARVGDARAQCGAADSWSGELALSGRVRNQTVRGRLLAGTTAAGSIRLEGIAPFGAPVFALVAANDRASLLLPREERVLRDAPAGAVLEAIAGLPLSGRDLHAILTGCGLAADALSGGRLFDDEWAAVEAGPDRVIFARLIDGTWRIAGARAGAITIGYSVYRANAPGEIRLIAEADAGQSARLLLRLAQSEVNPDLPAEAFELKIPDGATPITLDELRRRGLGLAAAPDS